MDYSLYILQSEIKETFYIGSSDEPHRRVKYHNVESKGCTQRYRPWKIVYIQPFRTKQQARMAEQKLVIIDGIHKKGLHNSLYEDMKAFSKPIFIVRLTGTTIFEVT